MVVQLSLSKKRSITRSFMIFHEAGASSNLKHDFESLTYFKAFNAPVKLFCPYPPPTPPGCPGVRGKLCVIKKGGTLENEVKKGRCTGKWRN